MAAPTCVRHGRPLSFPFQRQRGGPDRPSRTLVSTRASKEPSSTEKPSPGLGLQAVWYAAEQFGNLVGLAKGGRRAEAAGAAPRTERLSREEALAEIRADYEQNYFVSGLGSMKAYDPNCYFADPFAGFSGTARFKKNVSNLGGLMRGVKLDLLDWSEEADSLKTRWRFSAILDLPWKPLLAAAGSTTHVFDKDTGLVVKHIEAWDVEPGKVLRQLLRPAAKLPGNRWEIGMQALHDGDGAGIWQAASPGVLQATLPLAPMLLLLHVMRGEALPGAAAALEAGCYVALLAAAGTEAMKIVRSMGGGESF